MEQTSILSWERVFPFLWTLTMLTLNVNFADIDDRKNRLDKIMFPVPSTFYNFITSILQKNINVFVV